MAEPRLLVIAAGGTGGHMFPAQALAEEMLSRGYPALPAMTAAWLTGTPRLIHEQNGVLGRVNRLFARRVDLVACGTWPTTLPSGVTGTHTGNPVRRAVLAQAGAAYEFPKKKPLNILSIGGSQGARILSNTMPKAVALLDAGLRKRLRVSQQAREADAETCEKAYAFAGVAAEVSPFFTDLPARMAAAQLVVSRSGASSVADIAVVGRPSILVPLAIATDDHQAANARALNDAGAAVVILESELAPETLAKHITAILTDPAKAEFMAGAAHSQGKPEAAKALADLVEKLATKEPRA